MLFITHDVNEAVFLANRVVVLSHGAVLDDIAIDLPRPRAWDALIEDAALQGAGRARAAAGAGGMITGGSDMGLMRDAVRSTRGRIVIGAIVALVLWKLALVLLAPAKVTPGFTPNARGQVNVLVTLTCTPERFHVLAFQQYRSRLGHAGRVDRSCAASRSPT